MTPELIARYQPGGDIYLALADELGPPIANQAAALAAKADRGALNELLNAARSGTPLPTFHQGGVLSRLGGLGSIGGEIASDPLGAPLDAANRQITKLASNTALAFLRNPAVLLVLVLIGAVVWVNFFGVPRWAKR